MDYINMLKLYHECCMHSDALLCRDSHGMLLVEKEPHIRITRMISSAEQVYLVTNSFCVIAKCPEDNCKVSVLHITFMRYSRRSRKCQEAAYMRYTCLGSTFYEVMCCRKQNGLETMWKVQQVK